MSQVTVMGNLGRDAKLRSTQSGDSVCNFSLCANVRKGRDDVPVWYDCTLWGKRAEAIAQYLTKGTIVCVTGQLVPREYEGKDNTTRHSLDIDVRELAFAGGGDKSAPDRGQQRNSAPPPVDDEDVPF